MANLSLFLLTLGSLRDPSGWLENFVAVMTLLGTPNG
jgi:hypothetical protein